MPFFRVGDTLAECLHHSLRFFTYYCAKSFNWRNCHHTNKLFLYSLNWASLVAQMVKNLSTVWETQVRSLGWKDSPEKEMATHSSILAGRIAWTKEPGGLQSMELQRVGHDWVTNTYSLIFWHPLIWHLQNPFLWNIFFQTCSCSSCMKSSISLAGLCSYLTQIVSLAAKRGRQPLEETFCLVRENLNYLLICSNS